MTVEIVTEDGDRIVFETQEEADEWVRNYRDTHLRDSLSLINNIRLAAKADIQTAADLKQQSEALSAQLSNLSATVASWTPGATYRQSDMILVRDQIKNLIDRQKTIVDALTNMYAYRRANDESTTVIYRSLLWVANHIVRIADEDGV